MPFAFEILFFCGKTIWLSILGAVNKQAVSFSSTWETAPMKVESGESLISISIQTTKKLLQSERKFNFLLEITQESKSIQNDEQN